MAEKTESYEEAFKATSIFGGVQVFNVLISLIRYKIVAVLLGKAGMGMLGILQLPLGIVGLITEMGLGASSVRDIAEAQTSGDITKISRTVKTVKRWVWATGILGMFVVIVISPLLSKWTDESSNYTGAFLLLSVTLLFTALSGGQTAILRGLRRIKDTAKVGLLSSSVGLILSLPLFYLYGIKGIVPSLIIYSFIGLLTSWYFSRKVKLPPVTISYKESVYQGKEMVKLGIVITLSNIVIQIVSYAFALYLKNRSGADVVGLYNAGSAITNQYVALIFTAMTIDYFPRLVGLKLDRGKMTVAVNQQAEIALLIIAPLILLFLSFLPFIVHLIYSRDFLPIIDFAQWMILGMLIKTASWALSYIIIAKGDNFLYLLTEIISNVLFLILNIVGYNLFGLNGIGVAFVLQYIAYFILIFSIVKKRYQISFTKEFNMIFLFQFILCLFCFLVVKIKGYPVVSIVGSVLFIISTVYSLKKLNNKLNIKGIFKSKNLNV